MALDLRENEVVLSEVDFHWLSYLTSGFFMVIGAAFFLTGFADMELYLFLLGFCLILPFFYVYLSNRYKIYLVTNELPSLVVDIRKNVAAPRNIYGFHKTNPLEDRCRHLPPKRCFRRGKDGRGN